MSARILVVDDIEANRKLLQAKLRHEYFEVITAIDGPDALDKAFASKPDVILMDVMMPRIDGVETCKRLKFDPRTEHIPVVMVTALGDREDRLRSLNAGADDFLTKPIDDLQLLSRVRALTRFKLVADELRLRAVNGHSVDNSEEVPSHDPASILIFDSNQRQAGRICRYLEDEHHPFTLGENGPLGLSSQTQLDLIIVSLADGQPDGLRMCARLRSLPMTRDIPLLAVADSDAQDRAVRALELGASDILIKPLDAEELLARTRTQLRRKRYLDALRRNLDTSMQMAVIDQLTGLRNRRYMSSRLSHLVSLTNHAKMPISILMADLDHFKQINDTLGHDAGDQILREFASRLISGMRPADIPCRYGGEEFVILMPDTPHSMAVATAERLLGEISHRPFAAPGGHMLPVTFSGGVATACPPDDSPDAVMKRADQALYAAKRSGRNRIVSEYAGPVAETVA